MNFNDENNKKKFFAHHCIHMCVCACNTLANMNAANFPFIATVAIGPIVISLLLAIHTNIYISHIHT